MRASASYCRYSCLLTLAFLAAGLTPTVVAQPARPSPSYPAHLLYAFSNFVWWSDADLHALLKKRVPGLNDEIAPTQAAESRLRDTLRILLKEKGIVADVMSENPSLWSLTAELAPNAPGSAVVFSILNPQILVDQATVSGAPEAEVDAVGKALKRAKNREYSAREDWSMRSQIEQLLQQDGYLDATADFDHDAPRLDGNHYLVNFIVSINPGPQYHIATITGDGGPLLKGHDLSSFLKTKSGDIATPSPWTNLAGRLRGLYEHYGYSDVVVEGPPVLDRDNALVSYHLTVNPKPVYHLRTLTINNLDAGQESKARRLLGLQPGDLSTN